jgi:Uncharacterized conserved protein|nr:MAG: hypothetical protein J07AB56_07520 [Candidatus Nanosalinarum sp. J07AB56]
MEKTGNADTRLEKIPEFHRLDVEDGEMFFQSSGCAQEKAEEIIRGCLIHGLTPEPVRTAHLIGRGLHSHGID